MRAAALSIFGLLFILPIQELRSKRNSSTGSGTATDNRSIARKIAREISGTLRGTNYHRPTIIASLAFTSSCLSTLWIMGLNIKLSLACGLVATFWLYIRWTQITKLRENELRSFWSSYLDQTRAKMLTTSRALPYVFFDQTYIGSRFLNELLQDGRREFENSGDLGKALLTIWEQGNEDCTSYVCSALCNSIGATTSQIEDQLKIISSTLRSRNALNREADSRLAGVRTARTFIVIIPLGMALAGLSFAGSTAPFTTPFALLQIAIALLTLVGCWIWSNRLMTFPKLPTRTPKLLVQQEENSK